MTATPEPTAIILDSSRPGSRWHVPTLDDLPRAAEWFPCTDLPMALVLQVRANDYCAPLRAADAIRMAGLRQSQRIRTAFLWLAGIGAAVIAGCFLL